MKVEPKIPTIEDKETFEKFNIIRITGVYYAPNAAFGRVLE